MMVLQVVAATLGDDVEVVMTARPYLTRTDECAVERIVGIVHLIHAEYRSKAVLVNALLWATRGSPSIFGSICFHTSGKTGASAVSSRQSPLTLEHTLL